MAILDLLPLEGLKLLAEFVAFLQAKFKLPHPIITQSEPSHWEEELNEWTNSLKQRHPFAKMSKEEVLAKLRQTREEVYHEVYGDRYGD